MNSNLDISDPDGVKEGNGSYQVNPKGMDDLNIVDKGELDMDVHGQHGISIPITLNPDVSFNMGRVTSKVGSKTIGKGKGKTKALNVTPKKSKNGIWARLSERPMIIKEEVKPTNIHGPKRKSSEEGKGDVIEEEQSKRLTMDEETKGVFVLGENGFKKSFSVK